MDNIATDLQLLYEEIYKHYLSEKSAVEKWNDIALILHHKNPILIKTFKSIKKNDDHEKISLDYNMGFDQLQKQISSESDDLRKCSFIILAMHHIIYNLMTVEGNYYFNLDGKEQMDILKEDIMYYVNVSIKKEQNVNFHAFILLYGLESLFNKRFYVGIDFEFTERKNKLAQLNFEHDVSTTSIIQIISPAELEPDMLENFIYLIICNKYVNKILHGSDSLDIPYLFEIMLQSDPNKIIKFTKSFIDTRFLCEYYKLNRNEESNNKCSIYNEEADRSAIYYFGVVSEEQQQKLSELLVSMPADIEWNVHKLPKSQLLYAQYDVMFLKYFYYRIINVATKDESTDLGKKAIIELYKHVLTQLTQYIYLESNSITFLRNKCKEEVDVLNNYFVKKPNTIIKMIDIYNQVLPDLSTVNPMVDIDKILKVNYFRTTVATIIKRMVYGHISQKCRVYKDKSTLWTDKLYNKFILDFFTELKFNYLYSMFKDLDGTLEAKVRNIC